MLLQEFKIKASEYQKKHLCKRSEALHAVAKELGFKNYNAYLGSLKEHKTTEVIPSHEVVSLIPNTLPNWAFVGPVRDAKTNELIDPNDFGMFISRKELEAKRAEREKFKDTIKNSVRYNPDDPMVYLGTGKKTTHEAFIHQLNQPDSDLLKGYTIEESAEDFCKEDLSIKSDTTMMYKAIDLLKDHFGYKGKVKPLKIKKSSLPKIPKDFVGSDKDYYNRLLIHLRQDLMDNMTLENCINFIIRYNAIYDYLMKAYPGMFMCGCLGPKNGEPLCPCRMKKVFKLRDVWFRIDHDEKKRIRIKPCNPNIKSDIVFYVAESSGQYVLTD